MAPISRIHEAWKGREAASVADLLATGHTSVAVLTEPPPVNRQLCPSCHGAYAQPVFDAGHRCWVCGGRGYAREEVVPCAGAGK